MEEKNGRIPDVKEAVSEAMKSGRLLGFAPDCSPQQVEALWGEPVRTEVKKGEKTMVYPEADFVFEAHGLRQVTIRIQDARQQSAARSLAQAYPTELADEVPPYFRCLRLLMGPCALEEVLLTTAFSDTRNIVCIAAVFPRPLVRTLEVELPLDVYARLQDLSASTRRTIGQLCAEWIRRGIERDSPQEER